MTSLTSMAGLSSGVQNAGRTMMNARIAAAVSKGTISATDQTALGSALDSIDSTIASGGSAGSGTTGTSMKDRMDSLIDDQVTKGTLTSDQAGELKQFFAAGGRQGESTDAASGSDSDSSATATKVAGADGVSGPHGHGGAHHAHHAHASSGTSDTDSTDATSSTVSTDAASSTDTEKSQLDTLIGFLEKMRSSIGNQSTYGTSTSSGSTSSSDSTGLVFSGVA